MSFPQGINFRDTAGYVTDGTNYDNSNSSRGSYPWVTSQGNSVGWVDASTIQFRNRNASNDPRLAGLNYTNDLGNSFRIDLPAPGVYLIGISVGDNDSGQSVGYDLYDNVTSLGSLTTGTTSAAQRYKDATNTEYTDTTWPTSQTLVSKTFASTILLVTSTAAVACITSLYVAAAGSSPTADKPGNMLLMFR